MAFVHKIRQVQLIGPKIRKLRKQRKLTQTDLASRIGIQQSDLSRMEKGEYRVSLDNLFKILAEFDVSIGEFFDDPAPPVAAPEGHLVRDIELLSPDARREVEAFVAFKRRHEQDSAGNGSAAGATADGQGAPRSLGSSGSARATRIRLERQQITR